MDTLTTDIRVKLEQVQDRIARAAASAGRDPGQVRLVVVTKAQPVEVVMAAAEAGARIFGENYPEESLEKIAALRAEFAVEWHMIGHLQSRKAGIVATNFHMLHTLDSLRLAEKLERSLESAGRVMPVLVEVNVGGEESKYGLQAEDESRWYAVEEEIAGWLAFQHLRVRGLMTMPPWSDDPEVSRPYFVRLRGLAERLAARFGEEYFRELSMGTSSDYETAVQEGATYVRIGTAIVGPRPPKTTA